MYLQGKDPVYGAQMLIVYAAVSVFSAPAAGTAGPYAVLAGSACSFPLLRLPCALHLGVPWSRTSRIYGRALFRSMRSPPMAWSTRPYTCKGRSRLRCPNVDRIRRRFRSSSPGCWYSGAICGAGGQRVFLPSVPSALRPLFAWCSVEMNQPHPNGRALFCSMWSPPMAWSTRPYTCKGRSRLRCPNVDRIRRRFRSSSPGCRCSGAIRGAGGQRVFLPFVPPALRPLSAWCSV